MTDSPSATADLRVLRERLAARYAVERELGRGGMGAVYLARGEASQAVAAFEKSVKLAPEKKEYRDRLNEAKRRAASH